MRIFLHYSFLLFSTFSLFQICISWTGFKPEDIQSDTRAMELFNQWRVTHGKSYQDFDEELNRFENFKRNMKYIFEVGSNRTGYSVGLNRFGDMSNEEFREKYLSKVGLSQRKHTRGGLRFNSDHGVSDVEESETALLCATVNQPIIVGLDGSSIDFQLYTGGIYDGPCSSNPVDINHAVLIVGYGSEGDDDYWIVKNSWGTTWGMDGYIYIRRNTNLPYGVCAINALASYPLQTTLASSPSSAPSPLSPPPYNPPPQPSLSPPAPTPSNPTPPPPYKPPTPSPPAPSEPPPAPSPPSPPPYHPPPPPSHKCGGFSFCRPGQTCCCLYESFGFCLIQGCCNYTNAVCCPESDYCCPLEYPICDLDAGLCLQNDEDKIGLELKKKTWAKLTLPWSEYEGNKEITYQPLKWRRYGFAQV